MNSDSTLSKRDLLLLAYLFLFEGLLVVVLKALHLKGERPFDVFLTSTPGLVWLGAGLVMLLAGAGLLRLYWAHRRAPSRYFRLIVAMNLVTVLLMLVMGEVAVRAGARLSHDREAFGTVALKPKNWDLTRRHYREVLERASGDLSYLIYDERMGWSIGPNRRSANGLYRSSPTGIRVSQEGMAVPRANEKTTVALVGDSYTFGEEVEYEDSWGAHLDQLLGDEVQVLNFGVPGYGVDQAYLRYEKDVRRLKPTVAIFGLFSHDLRRTMEVYSFRAHPQWEMPFSKPRFILANGRLERVNEPPLRPDAIFSHPSIGELPFLDLDRGYEESTWQQRVYHASYLVRLFVSWFSPWSAVTPEVSEEQLVSINAAIVKAFARTAAQDGTIPVVIYFPGRTELGKATSPPSMVERVLQEAGLAYLDPTPCLLEVNPADRYMPGGHYTPAGNAAVAHCLGPVVQEALRHAAGDPQMARAQAMPASP